EKMAALKAPSIWDLGPKAARAAMRSSIFRSHDDPMGKTEDRRIPGPGGEIGIRIYTPLNAPEGPLPGLVFFHGGGFVLGDLDTHDGLCRALCNESGCRTVSVDYRLAPEHPFPAAVEDSWAATQWVAQNAASLGIDAARLAVGGDSAGGNLAAVVAQLANGGGPKLVYQLLIYPVAQMASDGETASMRENAKGYFLERESMDWYTRCYAPDPEHRGDPRLSPLLCKDLAGLPPAYVVTAGYDPLHDEGRDYADALAKAGVPVTYVNYPGMIHGFFSFRGYIPKAREAVAAAGASLRVAVQTAL
ncbi:MAG TPA: alpha/beta hydrolase, partial [Rhizomicrobium sp.]